MLDSLFPSFISFSLQIDVFLDKIVSFPLEIKCWNIITLDLSFFYTAIPTVITYVLVLIQFKEGDKYPN